MHRGLKAETEEFFILAEPAARSGVTTLLRGGQARPPLFARSIDGLGTLAFQHVANIGCGRLVVGKGDDHAAAITERVFIEKNLVLRKAFVSGFLEFGTGRGPDSGPCSPDDGSSQQS